MNRSGNMNIFLIYAFMFSGGSVIGWALEVVFRKFFSNSNPEHKWINPGFLNGWIWALCALYDDDA